LHGDEALQPGSSKKSLSFEGDRPIISDSSKVIPTKRDRDSVCTCVCERERD